MSTGHPMGKKFYIKTFGCQMNKHDSSIITQILHDCNYEQTDDLRHAHIVIVNTCSVRKHAEQRALGYIAGLRPWRSQHGKIVAVVGCMAERLGNDIAIQFPFVDLILGPDAYRQIGDFVDHVDQHHTKIIETALKGEIYCGIYPVRSGVSDFVTIMRGCDNFCSYCVVPYVRGRARSRPSDDIIKEIVILVQGGVKDITLLGQNVNEYSYNGIGFADLLKMVAAVPHVFRMRFLTSHPKDLNDATIETVKKHKNICEWFHLPLQSGCNRILTLMNRQYTREQYFDIINTIKMAIPEATITTDVIVGFPTETEEEFAETLAVMEKVKFDDAYMYRYSPRQGTAAYAMNSVPEDSIKRRLRTLIDFQNKIVAHKTKQMIDKRYEVLFEARAKSGATRGKTRGNKDIIVERTIAPGEVRDVIIKEVRGRTPIGEIV